MSNLMTSSRDFKAELEQARQDLKDGSGVTFGGAFERTGFAEAALASGLSFAANGYGDAHIFLDDDDRDSWLEFNSPRPVEF